MVNTTKPLYVGIAASQSLGERVAKNHLRRTRSSALRRTLTGLLFDTASLRGHVVADASNRSKFGLDATGEATLTRWMLENLQVTWVALAAPGEDEKSIIGDLLLSLNDMHARAVAVPCHRRRAASRRGRYRSRGRCQVAWPSRRAD